MSHTKLLNSTTISGRSLTAMLARLPAGRRAAIMADWVEGGFQFDKPTIAQAAALAKVSRTYVKLAMAASPAKRKAIAKGRARISDVLRAPATRLALPAPTKPLVEVWDAASEAERVETVHAHGGEILAWLESLTAPRGA